MDNFSHSPLVSILVSCYNVERYIENLYNNIKAQTYTNIELIIVDDGSTDRTLELLNAYFNSFQNTKIIRHNENLGLGAGRNTGLDNARGDYVYFYDVDDHMKSNLIEQCVFQMEQNAFDYLIFGFDVQYPDSNICPETVSFQEKIFTTREEIRKNYVDCILLSKHGNGFVWNKFFRRSFIEENGLRFGMQKIQQDEVFNIKAILSASSLKILPDSLYVYNIFTSGNNGSRFIPDRFEIFVCVRTQFNHLFETMHLKSEGINDYINKRFWGNIMKCLQYDLMHKDCKFTYKQKRQRFYQIISHPYSRESISYLFSNKHLLNYRSRLYLGVIRSYELFGIATRVDGLLIKIYKAINR